jgi:hypothetical protein
MALNCCLANKLRRASENGAAHFARPLVSPFGSMWRFRHVVFSQLLPLDNESRVAGGNLWLLVRFALFTGIGQ